MEAWGPNHWTTRKVPRRFNDGWFSSYYQMALLGSHHGLLKTGRSWSGQRGPVATLTHFQLAERGTQNASRRVERRSFAHVAHPGCSSRLGLRDQKRVSHFRPGAPPYLTSPHSGIGRQPHAPSVVRPPIPGAGPEAALQPLLGAWTTGHMEAAIPTTQSSKGHTLPTGLSAKEG